ncbi:hypothetical protein BROUX41_006361 [Berkeleyomyces rouxiae]|uniref:uncharacterized protein n=1 Tax=Berkeleyomyces rouxiae TaxID=2035830 RepID=UPI003B79AEAD
MSSNDCATSAIPINNPSHPNMDRRGSVGNAVFSNLFRSNSISTQPSAATAASVPDTHRRRLSSVSVGLHQSGIAPPSTTPANFTLAPAQLRRSSTISLLDENAIEDDDTPSPLSGRSPPLSSISSRRASFARPRTVTGTASPPFSLSPTSTNLPLDHQPPPRSTAGLDPEDQDAQQPGYRVSDDPMPTESYLAGAVRRISLSGPAAAKSAREAVTSVRPRKTSLPSSQPPAALSSNLHSASRATDQQQQHQHFTWADQLRSRAEGRSSTFMSSSPPRGAPYSPVAPTSTTASSHRRESSISSEMMPPYQTSALAPAPASASVPSLPTPRAKPRQKPDAFQERILKGDFYMD